MMPALDLAVAFLDATPTDLASLILALVTTDTGPLPPVVDVIDETPEWPTSPLLWRNPHTGNLELLPLDDRQCRTLRELLALHQWATGLPDTDPVGELAARGAA